MLANWLRRKNLKGFLIVVSDIIGYEFDDLDWGAFEAGFHEAVDDGWFTYPLVGRRCTLEVAISLDVDEDDVILRVTIPPGASRFTGKIEVAWRIFNHCDVSPDVYYIPAEAHGGHI